jgi:hypothetical protein
VNRAGWRQLATDRVSDADALLAAGRWAGAYYVVGYAIECALKACVLARVENTGVIFDDPKFAAQVRTHKAEDLPRLADLEPAFGLAKQANPVLLGFWGVVTTWSEESRYQTRGEPEARELHQAITNDPDGVLRWLQQHW